MAFLESNTIIPGTLVTVKEVLVFNQTIKLEMQEKDMTLGFASARYVFVERPK